MLNVILLGIRFVILVLAGHKEIALENAGLRQQLAVFKRDINRPRLRRRDRIFWMGLRAIWKDWKSALMIVRPETVISWQRKRFNRYWWRLSQPKGPGRPRLSAEIRNLITTMAAANLTYSIFEGVRLGCYIDFSITVTLEGPMAARPRRCQWPSTMLAAAPAKRAHPFDKSRNVVRATAQITANVFFDMA